jgi:tRNA pseudouridine55 synthase
LKERSGLLSIDKPEGITSFAVVAAVRRVLRCRKVGHAGTLDPAASGLLVLALGGATRALLFLPLEPKLYRFGVRFGVATDTLDKEGKIVRSGGAVPSAEALEGVLPRFCGVLSQVPPQFSAIKKGGVHAYSLARQGRSVELAARRIEVFSLRLVRYDPDAAEALLEVSCSGGTYVRSLARDIAEALGTCGYASSVRRLAAGNFHVDRALPFDKLDRVEGSMITVKEAVGGLPQVTVDVMQKKSLMQGNEIVCNVDGETVFAFDEENNLAAVLKKQPDQKYHPVKVFIKNNE